MFVVTQICYSLLTIWWCDNDKNYNDDGDIIKKKSHDIRFFFSIIRWYNNERVE